MKQFWCCIPKPLSISKMKCWQVCIGVLAGPPTHSSCWPLICAPLASCCYGWAASCTGRKYGVALYFGECTARWSIPLHQHWSGWNHSFTGCVIHRSMSPGYTMSQRVHCCDWRPRVPGGQTIVCATRDQVQTHPSTEIYWGLDSSSHEDAPGGGHVVVYMSAPVLASGPPIHSSCWPLICAPLASCCYGWAASCTGRKYGVALYFEECTARWSIPLHQHWSEWNHSFTGCVIHRSMSPGYTMSQRVHCCDWRPRVPGGQTIVCATRDQVQTHPSTEIYWGLDSSSHEDAPGGGHVVVYMSAPVLASGPPTHSSCWPLICAPLASCCYGWAASCTGRKYGVAPSIHRDLLGSGLELPWGCSRRGTCSGVHVRTGVGVRTPYSLIMVPFHSMFKSVIMAVFNWQVPWNIPTNVYRIMYVLEWWTVWTLTSGLFWCIYPELLSNEGNKHQNNVPVSADTVRHKST